MEGERWKPLVETPSKPPIPPSILVPDPSPARSSVSDEESLTILPPSPEGSFIHRRRHAQYVPRPLVWKIEHFGQEFKDLDTSYDNYPVNTELGNSNLSGLRLPGISRDDQIRQMANAFNEQPLVVNMMTGRDTEDTAKAEDAHHAQFEAELTAALGPGSKLAVGERSYVDSGNPSGGTTALGSNRSSNLMEKNIHTAESLGTSTLTPRNAATTAPVLNDPFTASDDFPETHLAPQEAWIEQKGKQREEVPTSAGGLPSHDTTMGSPSKLEESQQEAAIDQDQAKSRLSRSRNDENGLTYLTSNHASHLAKASRLPNALKNSSATEEAGLVNLPEAPESEPASTVQQRPTAKKRSLKNLIPGSMRRSTAHDAGFSRAQSPRPLSPGNAPRKAVEEAKEKQNRVQRFKTWSRKLTSGIRGNIRGSWSRGPFKSKKLRTSNMGSDDLGGSSEVHDVLEPTLHPHSSDDANPVRNSSETGTTVPSSEGHSQSASSQQPFDSTHVDRDRQAHPGKPTMKEDPRDMQANAEVDSSSLVDLPAFLKMFDHDKENNRRSWSSGHASQASRFQPKAKDAAKDDQSSISAGQSGREQILVLRPEQDENNSRRSWSSGHASQASRFLPKVKRDQDSNPASPQSMGGQDLVTHPAQNDAPTTASPVPVQAPLGDITNSSRPRLHRPRITANQPEASGPFRSNEGSPTSQEMYEARMDEAQEEIVPAPPPASRPMTSGRPNALRPEIRELNPNSSLSRQSSG
ncbi:MAG: hypothetical protein Q9191_003607 [Dirinaria sp. TL-2023a]